MSRRVELVNALVDALMHPTTQFSEDPTQWRSSVKAITENIVGGAVSIRDEEDSLGILAAAVRLSGAGNLGKIDEIALALADSVKQIEEASKL
jgi:hypothetical protein